MKRLLLCFLLFSHLTLFAQNGKIDFDIYSGLYGKKIASIELDFSNEGYINNISLTPIKEYNPLTQDYSQELVMEEISYRVTYDNNSIYITDTATNEIVYQLNNDSSTSVVNHKGSNTIEYNSDYQNLKYQYDSEQRLAYIDPESKSIAYLFGFMKADDCFFIRKGSVWQNVLMFESSSEVIVRNYSIDSMIMQPINFTILSGITFNNGKRQIALRRWEDLYLPFLTRNMSIDYEQDYVMISGIRSNGILSSVQNSTSFLVEKSISYLAANTIVEDNSLPWVEGVVGYGINESLTISWNNNISGLLFYNGFYDINRPQLFQKNSRIKKVLLTNDRGDVHKIVQLYDHPYPQIILLDKKTSDLKITILEVYEGDVWTDTCLNSIMGLDDEDSDLIKWFLK